MRPSSSSPLGPLVMVLVAACGGAGGTVARDAPAVDAPRAPDAAPGSFPPGTICNDSGTPRARPATVAHVIVILMENKSYGDVHGNVDAPYVNELAARCGHSTRFLDNLFAGDRPSLPHYLALTSGSNCDTGLDASGTACILDDADPSAHRLSGRSIFSEAPSWRAYQEDMGSACNPRSTGRYAVRHNPPPYFSALADCARDDLPIARIACPDTIGAACAAPDNQLTRDLAGDTLAAFTFITPDLVNDMHDGTVAQGDNWLRAYLPLVFAAPAYLRGEVAVYVLWDEGTLGRPQPNLFIAPTIAPTASDATMNLFAVLRAIEDQLGVGAHLGCAGGAPPGGAGVCPDGSNADLRAIFNF